MIKKIDEILDGVSSANYLIRKADRDELVPELRRLLQSVLEDIYASTNEARSEARKLQMEVDRMRARHGPKPEPATDDDPDWVVKPVPVGSQEAKQIIAKVAADNPPKTAKTAKIPDATRDKIVADLKQGMGVAGLAAKYHVSQSSIHNIKKEVVDELQA